MRSPPFPSRIFMSFCRCYGHGAVRAPSRRDTPMLFHPRYDNRVGRLADELLHAQAVTPGLIAKIIAEACARVPVLDKAGKAARLGELTAAAAWTDVALTLVELEPAWRLRRLVYEDGEWVCSLGQQPNVPASIDDTIDAGHEVLPLAILSALVEARRRDGATRAARSISVPRVRTVSEHAVCCDNFA